MTNVISFPSIQNKAPDNSFEIPEVPEKLRGLPIFHCICGNNLVYLMKTGVWCPKCDHFTEPTHDQ